MIHDAIVIWSTANFDGRMDLLAATLGMGWLIWLTGRRVARIAYWLRGLRQAR